MRPPHITNSTRADLRLPWAGVQSREPSTDYEDCSLIGTDHDAHWYPLKDDRGSMRCIGWHAMTRDLTYTRARFHAPYLRGRNSNLIHRSRHEGWAVWFPRNFHRYGPAEIIFWDVGVGCTALTLRRPALLDAAGVRAAVPVPQNKYDTIHLCSKCFPTPGGTPCPI